MQMVLFVQNQKSGGLIFFSVMSKRPVWIPRGIVADSEIGVLFGFPVVDRHNGLFFCGVVDLHGAVIAVRSHPVPEIEGLATCAWNLLFVVRHIVG